jgi:FixJ family two-component response regulator/anti-sigma regulatory factor (Ser/Thr protein kinase)
LSANVSAAPPAVDRILLVDDDVLYSRLAELTLLAQGYAVTKVPDGNAARQALSDAGPAHFACLLTEYRLPDMSGFDLMAAVQREDPALASILVFGDAPKDAIDQTLQQGAIDFMVKPYGRDQIAGTVSRAVAVTGQRRQSAQMAQDVGEIGRIQRRMIQPDARLSESYQICFQPKHSAGGDFFSHQVISSSRAVALLTDVSGHDLKAAFVAAYFQGMVRAMLECGTPLISVFDRCNEFLLTEWGTATDTPTSVAVCSLLFDWEEGSLQVLSSGAPLPIFTSVDGQSQILGSCGSPPLGWMPEHGAESIELPVSSGHITLWTDGLEDLAVTLGASVCSVAHCLLNSQESGTRPEWLHLAKDDVMVVRLPLCKPGELLSLAESRFSPLLVESYTRADLPRIDGMQRHWLHSLKLSVPRINPVRLHDILLCAREGLMNALKHGCRTESDTASLVICYRETDKLVRLFIDDPGPGHGFDHDAHAAVAMERLVVEHRGLILMRSLSTSFEEKRNGASIAMEFLAE